MAPIHLIFLCKPFYGYVINRKKNDSEVMMKERATNSATGKNNTWNAAKQGRKHVV